MQRLKDINKLKMNYFEFYFSLNEIPVAQTVKHVTSNAKVMGYIPREYMNCIPLM